MDETLDAPSTPYNYGQPSQFGSTPPTKPPLKSPPRIGKADRPIDQTRVKPLFQQVMDRARNSFTNLFNFLPGLLSQAETDAEKNLVHGLIDEVKARINSDEYGVIAREIGGRKKCRKTKKVRRSK